MLRFFLFIMALILIPFAEAAAEVSIFPPDSVTDCSYANGGGMLRWDGSNNVRCSQPQEGLANGMAASGCPEGSLMLVSSGGYVCTNPMPHCDDGYALNWDMSSHSFVCKAVTPTLATTDCTWSWAARGSDNSCPKGWYMKNVTIVRNDKDDSTGVICCNPAPVAGRSYNDIVYMCQSNRKEKNTTMGKDTVSQCPAYEQN